MTKIKTFKNKKVEFEIGSFDTDKEIEFCISQDYNGGQVLSTWLNPNQANELIIHLAKCLRSVNEPIDLISLNDE